MSRRKTGAQIKLISNGVLEITPLTQVQKCEKEVDLKIHFLKLLYTTLLKGAYHIVYIAFSEVFNPSPVADTMQNLVFPN